MGVEAARADDEFALVLAGDENFAQGLAVSLHSALVSLSSSFRMPILVLDCGLSTASRSRLRRVAARAGRAHDLELIRLASERLQPLPVHSRFTSANYARLLIPELAPERVRRAIYLDADLLVRHDLSPLFSTELGGAVLGAVRDASIGTTSHLPLARHLLAEPRPYFNSGVLVVDLPGWRSAGLTDRAFSYAESGHPSLPFLDQDALNAVVGDWRELDPHWNLQLWSISFAKSRLLNDAATYRRDRRRFRTAGVLHFTGPKPWSHTCETPGTMLWVRTLLRSGWYTPREAAIWLPTWLGKRAAYWPRVSRRRWGARIAALQRVARGLVSRR